MLVWSGGVGSVRGEGILNAAGEDTKRDRMADWRRCLSSIITLIADCLG